jgi:4-carboxymuconolactone decarboxylase
MKQHIHLAAIVLRDDCMFLVRPAPDAPWELPGGPLLASHADVDAGMDAILSALWVNAPAIEDDFVRTIYLPAEEGQTVYNIYAPSEWTGEPVAEGAGTGWFGLEAIEAMAMDEVVRQAVLEEFGLRAPIDESNRILEALGGAFVPEQSGRVPALRGRAGGLDVLGTLTGGDPAAVEARPYRQYPELAGDVVEAIGNFWTGPAVDRRTKSLQVVAMLAAQGGRSGPLRSHINGALNHGASPDQVIETLRMVAIYAGFPAALEAWPVMEEVFATRNIARPGKLE